MNLGELLAVAKKATPPEGNVSGVCVVCCKETNKGFPLKKCISGNFTGWSYLYSGNCMCPECAFLFSDQTFRKRSWVASLSGFRTFKNDEALEILFSPPEPPFFIHIAKLGQRQTWLSCLNRIASDSHRYFLSHEKYDIPILFERAKAEEFAKDVKRALELGITKSELLTGEFKPKTWKKILQHGKRNFLKELAQRKGDPLWEVIVDVGRK
ncbi:MAG: hypothetical protein J7J22_02065 [Candidatus Verstraetearchaeota archaeon]|nr:hypothetical protein [Candidatus Verstraetearchaeota archaeon]